MSPRPLSKHQFLTQFQAEEKDVRDFSAYVMLIACVFHIFAQILSLYDLIICLSIYLLPYAVTAYIRISTTTGRAGMDTVLSISPYIILLRKIHSRQVSYPSARRPNIPPHGMNQRAISDYEAPLRPTRPRCAVQLSPSLTRGVQCAGKTRTEDCGTTPVTSPPR